MLKLVQADADSLRQRVALRDLALDLDLSVGQPATHGLRELKVGHVRLDPAAVLFKLTNHIFFFLIMSKIAINQKEII